MDIINSWWFLLIIGTVGPAVLGLVIHRLVRDRRYARLMALGAGFALEAVNIIEERYPKGHSPGPLIKLRKAINLVQLSLEKEGFSAAVIESAYEDISKKVEKARSEMSGYKNTQLKAMGLIRDPLKSDENG